MLIDGVLENMERKLSYHFPEILKIKFLFLSELKLSIHYSNLWFLKHFAFCKALRRFLCVLKQKSSHLQRRWKVSLHVQVVLWL